jgi:hypothetical protein
MIVTVYVVEVSGLARGCAMFDALSPDEGLHRYEFPETDGTPSIDEGVLQFKSLSGPAASAGKAWFTKTVISSIELQPLESMTVRV